MTLNSTSGAPRARTTGPLAGGTGKIAPAAQPAPGPAARKPGDARVATGELTSAQAIVKGLPGKKLDLEAIDVPGGAHAEEQGASAVVEAKAMADAVKLPVDINEAHALAKEHLARKAVRVADVKRAKLARQVKGAKATVAKAKSRVDLHRVKQTRAVGAPGRVQALRTEATAARKELEAATRRAAGKATPELKAAQARAKAADTQLAAARKEMQAVRNEKTTVRTEGRAARQDVRAANERLNGLEKQHGQATAEAKHLRHELEAESAAHTPKGLARVAKLGAGAVTTGAGVVGIFVGIDEIQTGRREGSKTLMAGGALDIGAGAATTVAGASSVAEAAGVAATTANTAARVAGAAAVPLTGAAAVLTGGYQGYSKGKELGQLQRRLAVMKSRPNRDPKAVHALEAQIAHTRMERNCGWVKSAAGALMIAGTAADATVIGAAVGVPMQVVGGVMLAGASVYESWDKIVPAARDAKRYVGQKAHEATDWAAKKLHALTSWF